VPGLGVHQADFLRACKEGYQPASNFSYAGPLSEVVLLGCLAIRAGVGKPIVWDPVKLKAAGLPELDPLIRRSYRKGWTLS
jgi:hypothetical protein